MYPNQRNGNKETYDTHYRRIEAMYHKGYSIEEMVKESPTLTRIEAIDIIQTIFASIQMRKEAQARNAKKMHRSMAV